MIPYTSIEQAERIETPISTDMINALNDWYNAYTNQAPWLTDGDVEVKSLNLPAFISSELARQIIIELKWDITGTTKDAADGEGDEQKEDNPRAAYLREEFGKLFDDLRQKLEQGCAAGGMTIRPYPKDGHIYFGWTMAWALYPVAFSDSGELVDVIFPDTYTKGKTVYTRLERHQKEGKNVRITQRVFESTSRNTIGREVSLDSVDAWKDLKPEVIVNDSDGQMFGWYKVAAANSIDVESPMGASVFAKALDLIKEADRQYSRLLWEYEGSELAIDVDPTALRPRANGAGVEMPKLNKRLFRAVDIDKGDRDLYNVFSPAIRDANFVNGLNQILTRVEDLSGLSRGTISDANVAQARTATEMRILKQRSYATISDNQKALEACLLDVIRAMDVYASMYHLAPKGGYEVSFDWDDSILIDKEMEKNADLAEVSSGLLSKVEYRMKHRGETKAQAQAALLAIQQENEQQLAALLPSIRESDPNEPPQDDNGATKGVSPAGGTPPQPTQPTS